MEIDCFWTHGLLVMGFLCLDQFMTKDKVLKLALEALEDLGMRHYKSTGEVLYKETFTAIKEALAQRTWVGLTDKDIWNVLCFRGYNTDTIEIAKAIEAKLKEKNT